MKEIAIILKQAARALAKGTDIPVCIMDAGRKILEYSDKNLPAVWKEEKGLKKASPLTADRVRSVCLNARFRIRLRASY